MRAIKGETANHVWCSAVDSLRAQSGGELQSGRSGPTNELLHVLLQIRHPRQRWVVSCVPAMSVAFAIVEVIGILNGRRDSGYLNFFNPGLPDFAGNGPEYHGAYGHRLRRNLGIDQLARAFRALRKNPDGRQVVLQIWNARQDFPKSNGDPVSQDIPCNICSMLKIRDNKLEWSQIMRSNDVFRGLPYNIVQFTCLQEVISGWLGVDMGSYVHFSDSLHIYERDLDKVYRYEHLELEWSNESLSLPKKESDPVWREMNCRVDLLVGSRLKDAEYRRLARIDSAPESFNNLMRVVAADAARRRKRQVIAHEIMGECTNRALIQLWNRWAIRKKAVKAATFPRKLALSRGHTA